MNLVDVVEALQAAPVLRTARARGLLRQAVGAAAALAGHSHGADPTVCLALAALVLQASDERCVCMCMCVCVCVVVGILFVGYQPHIHE
jgi:hypothetical protein